ncbi:MAG: class I SAM-dependent methyltransferase [Flammeovirgaceae bacterium]|nr:class I SAM-dependent methyltransferase [Flammeovirgaceae bacterium]
MGNLHAIQSFIKYQLKAQNAHGLHSPFVFDLFTQVIEPQKKYYAFDEIEGVRKKLLKDQRTIKVEDFGAGSKNQPSSERRLADIAKYSISKPKLGRLMFKLADYFKPETILELGTCLGINTLYLAKGYHKSTIFTFEGCPELVKIAAKNFKEMKVKPRISTGNLDETLKPAVKKLTEVDMVFFDANHQYQPTINYFKICLEKAHENSVFIFDDIYWSEGMTKAWEEIKAHQQVTLSVDLFQIGIVFFREKQPKQHFTLRF